ncbi:MAG: methyltransferase domain-containing protein, partial [Flammeovirgaceae bacterium]
GRWLAAGYDLGYIPIGFDIRLEFCETQQHIMKATKRKAYSIVADFEEIPLTDSLFDLIWSFITLEQVHKSRLENCLKCVDRLLTKDGFSYLQFPNKMGVR